MFHGQHRCDEIMGRAAVDHKQTNQDHPPSGHLFLARGEAAMISTRAAKKHLTPATVVRDVLVRILHYRSDFDRQFMGSSSKKDRCPGNPGGTVRCVRTLQTPCL
jgi:hypothetical protein